MIKRGFFFCNCFMLFSCVFLYFKYLPKESCLGYENIYKPEQWKDLYLSEERNENELNLRETECEECGKSVPNTIVQFGQVRSGSTLQFTTLCLLMLMLHEEEARSVGCYFNTGQESKYRVIKVHGFHFVEEIASPDTWVFMTVRSAADKKQHKMTQQVGHVNLTIKTVVDLDEVGRTGFFIATRYQSLFGLSDEKMLHILEFLRYWDILRVCCGQQMSRDWRNKLAPQKDYIESHDPHSLVYHACEMYNISQVEQLFINTYIFKKFRQIELMRDFIGKPSTVDGILDGNYCELCNKNIIKHNLQHNMKCIDR